jgi:hypothetical protein
MYVPLFCSQMAAMLAFDTMHAAGITFCTERVR